MTLCVLLVVGQLLPGGTERQVGLLGRGLADLGIDVHVAVLHDDGVIGDDLRAAGVPVHCVGMGTRATSQPRIRQLAGAVAGAARLTALMRRIRPDIVHAFLFHAYVVTPPLARLAGVPRVVAARRSLGYFRTGHRAASLIERGAGRLTDAWIANSEAVRQDTIVQEGRRPELVSVIPNALPTALTGQHHRPTEFDCNAPVIVCLANLLPIKRHDLLLTAVALAPTAEHSPQLVLIGEGPLRAELEARASALGLNALFVGSIAEPWDYLANADLVVLASDSEGSSNALAEAIALGRPVVATAVGGNLELLGSSGTMVAPNDAVALSAAIASVFSRLAEEQVAAGHARDALLARRELKVVAQQQLATYRQIMLRPRQVA